MKQSVILLAAALLATVINGAPLSLHKRDTSFAACSSGSPTPLTVSINPDPPTGSSISVTIGGTPPTPIAAATALVQAVDSTGNALGTAFTSDFCTATGIKCPIANGTQFSGVVNNVALPANLPSSFNLVVELLDASNNVLGCSTGAVTEGAAPAPDGTTPSPDASPSPDATTPDDGTSPTPDATTPDASPSPDATTPDASPSPDATTPDDATSPTPDATTPDDATSPSPDATTPDDATSPSPDTTTPDATTPDDATSPSPNA